MNTKLTLNIEKDLIEIAKKYAQESRQSLSSLVQNYFKHLTSDTKIQDNIDISPTVKNLSGIISLNNDYDYKEDYKKHINEEYS
ncbi:hypothetical protein KKC74_08340 [bacterium]|nr:hypothetical protein [bacterium]MBU1064797.1 hypothetical protein [bacterium]MBU1874524.1 hypothetical protein [bacterium]